MSSSVRQPIPTTNTVSVAFVESQKEGKSAGVLHHAKNYRGTNVNDSGAESMDSSTTLRNGSGHIDA